MGSVAIDLGDTRLALTQASAQVAALLRSLDGTDAPIANSTWTVRDAAAHLGADIRTNADAVSGADQHFDVPAQAGATGRLATLNARAIRDVATTDPDALARSVEDAVSSFLETTAGWRGCERVATSWYGEGFALDFDAMACVVLGELVVHGYDMAKAAGMPWPIQPFHARLALSGVADMLPLYSRPPRAAQARRPSRSGSGAESDLRSFSMAMPPSSDRRTSESTATSARTRWPSSWWPTGVARSGARSLPGNSWPGAGDPGWGCPSAACSPTRERDGPRAVS